MLGMRTAGAALMADLDELVRRGLQLEREIVWHEIECMMEDGAPARKIDAKLTQLELIAARQRVVARRDARLAEIKWGLEIGP
jgi:predicted subunit of tRNA(5-methylaminomethyl-2-thiouridylate) methyltransferase